MKKILLFALLITACSDLYAFTTQGNWRWRKDDGDETSATWLAAENAPITISTTDSTLRLRIELYNDPNNHSSGSGGLLDGALFEYSTDPNFGTYDTITLTEGDHAFVLAGTNSFVTNGDPTTKQITGQNLPFEAGMMIVSYDSLPAHTVAKGDKTEYEWVIKPTANLQAGTTYYFRVDAAIYPNGTPLPSLVTAGTLAVELTNFTVSADGGRVRLQWTTLTEQSNGRFDIERSANGVRWTTITSVAGSGNSTVTRNYEAYDNAPVSGVNYYRIRQYNVDGTSSISAIRSVKIGNGSNTRVTVYPNPSHGDISFLLHGYSGKLTATVSTLNGKRVYTESMTGVEGSNTLHMQTRLLPGLYVLQLKGDDFTESTKVIVQ